MEKKVATKRKKVATKEEKVATKKEKRKEVATAVAEEVEQVIENTDLTDNQKLFCLFYVKYQNKVKAYQKAYQCSYDNACGNASALWKNIEIRKRSAGF